MPKEGPISPALPAFDPFPQRASFEILDKRCLWLSEKEELVHQRELGSQNEREKILVIQKGLDVSDRIVLKGVRQVQDGDTVEYELRPRKEVMANQKNHAD